MERLEIFQQYRSLLFGIAYRMLGSITEAEDILQEAWIRWQNSTTTIELPKAFLCSTVSRLCIDRLRFLNREKKQYSGMWLPEPFLENYREPERYESVSYAFLVLLECLSPTERVVFILREVFDYEYTEIAPIVDKSVINCRQIFHRARKQIIIDRSKFNLSNSKQNIIIEQFLIAWNQGDLETLINLMSKDIAFYADGGGKVTAAQKPLYGKLKVTRFLLAIKSSPLIPKFRSQLVLVNRQSGILNTIEGQPQSIFSFHLIKGKVSTIFAIVNPDKLTKSFY